MVDNPGSDRPEEPPDEEVGDFAEGQEQEHHRQRPKRFSEGQENLPEEKDSRVGDFAEGQEEEKVHETGTFAEGQEDPDKS
jgi:hypothetical protein